MSVQDHKVAKNQGIGQKVIIFEVPSIPADQTDVEFRSTRLPDVCEWYVQTAHAWARAVSGTNAKTVNLEDDGTDLGTDTTVVAGAQTAITGLAGKKLAGGSELQLKGTTGATTTITDLVVTVVLEPLRLYGRQASPVVA